MKTLILWSIAGAVFAIFMLFLCFNSFGMDIKDRPVVEITIKDGGINNQAVNEVRQIVVNGEGTWLI